MIGIFGIIGILSYAIVSELNQYKVYYQNEAKCQDYAIMKSKNVIWMDGYKLCFDLDTKKVVKL